MRTFRRPNVDAAAGVDHDVDLIEAELRRLRELADDPDRSHDQDELYNAAIGWGVLVAGRLRRLASYHSSGRLAEDERARYERLRTALRDALPVIERLGLAGPGVPLG